LHPLDIWLQAYSAGAIDGHGGFEFRVTNQRGRIRCEHDCIRNRGQSAECETPWKTQLTKLESQDTAISSLGRCSRICPTTSVHSPTFRASSPRKKVPAPTRTCYTDRGQCERCGWDSHRAGAESGPDVKRISGSGPKRHTPLTGSITLQTGSGTPQTIALDSSDNTLTGLEGAINASGAGVTAEHIDRRLGIALDPGSGTSGAPVTSLSPRIRSPGSGLHRAANSGSQNSTGHYIRRRFDRYSLRLIFGADRERSTRERGHRRRAELAGCNTIYTGSGVNTLSGIAGAITAAGIGVTAAAVTNSDGTATLSLTSELQGRPVPWPSTRAWSTQRHPQWVHIVGDGRRRDPLVDGVKTTSASNTVANAISGVTFHSCAEHYGVG